jgi:glycyl-tRNA synthetase alpha subunit
MEIEEYGEKKGGNVIDAKSEPFQPHTLLKHAEEATMNRMSRVESNVRRPDDSLHVSRRQYIYIYKQMEMIKKPLKASFTNFFFKSIKVNSLFFY